MVLQRTYAPTRILDVDLQLFLLIIVVITALAFDFTNGFHDTGNAMATSIASGALKPKVAVALSASLNLVGAFLSTAVAATIAKGLIDAHLVTLELVFAGLVGGIVWNLMTWLLGIPSSSSHALIGGIVGAMLAAVGGARGDLEGPGVDGRHPGRAVAVIAGIVATVGTWLVYRVVRGVPEERTNAGFRYGQIGSASLVSLAHGTNDAQKTMGVIFLALISYGAASSTDAMPPLWVIVSCAVAIAAGTYLGGWRVIRTLGKGLVEIKSPQGMAAEYVVGDDHLAVQPLRLLAVHHPRRHRLDPGQRGRQARRRGALGRRGPDGHRVADHAALGRHRRRAHLLPGARHRRLRRRGDRLRCC